ncbi:50S ribosomal protein L25 [Tepidibacter formicigenes]|jgi:large subunit ribosomal protein L25|uniref:Large ribosomal subunit protein bL25 n=1 Tax=Tepidibacter formicigenes DSM 15518 TaxID=1123349 RepID=A0A1M6TT35_9FIRM|nr:50S ribosomal protein L25 [Tepidibacter formicigenes]SHK60107.1 large subunit ribosomal protein L25 [Tepidibacter formicigenes DSM 15518]
MELMIRNSLGNIKAKALRKKGIVPGVLYGKNMEPISVAVDKKELKRVYQQKKESEVFDINLDGQTHTVYIHEVQRDVIDDKEFTHFDLHKVTNEDFIHTHVPVVLVNKDEIESQGLVVQQQLLDVEVKYPVYNTTKQINADMSQLYNGGSLTVADLAVPQGVSVLEDTNAIVASVSYPKMYEPVEDIDEAE